MAFGLGWKMATLLTTLLVAPARAQPAPQTRPILPDELVRQTNQQLRETLMAPGSSLPQSEEAARRLLSHQNASSRAILLEMLGSSRRNAKIAAAEALADDPSPDPQFIAALLALLNTNGTTAENRPLIESAAEALARFPDNPEVRQRLLDFAKDKSKASGLREGVIRALGKVVSRDVANGLVDLLAEAPPIPAITNAATDALSEMTSLPIGHDAQQWKQWQASQAPLSDALWQTNTLKARSSHLAQTASEQTAFASALRKLFEAEYGAANQAKRFELTMSLLNSANPDMRLMGIDFVMQLYGAGQPRPPDSPKRIQELLADSDARVRKAAAKALRDLSLNSKEILEAILAQVVQEPDVDVRYALTASLGPLHNLLAVPTLRLLLNDPSLKVAGAAAESLSVLGATLLVAQPAFAHEIADQLWQTGSRRVALQDGLAFRAACIEAMGPFRDTKHKPDLLDLVIARPRQPEMLRVAALRALGPFEDDALASMIDRALQDDDNEKIRREMIDALAQTGKFAINAPTLYALSKDKTLGDSAWVVFTLLASKTTSVEILKDWIKRLSDQPTRQIVLQLALDKKLEEAGARDDWAVEIQNTGEIYMKTGQAHQAALAFEKAMDYWKSQPAAKRNTTNGRLESQRLDALLGAREYKDACAFVADQIRQNSSQVKTLEATIILKAETFQLDFVNNPNPKYLEDAKSLLEEALKLDRLEPRYRGDMQKLFSDINTSLRSLPPKRTP